MKFRCTSFFEYLIICLPIFAFSQSSIENNSNTFIDYLIHNDERLTEFIDESELELSNRLGIQYDNVSRKFLISYDIDEEIKEDIIRNKLDYEISIEGLEESYSKIIFNVKNPKYQKEFYFKKGKYISPITYFTRTWTQIKSEHFNFIVSDTTLFNSYCIKNLENFYIRIAGLLQFTKEENNKIQSRKIYYLLCKDEEEIKKLTGFHTRGMYILAYDYVVTTFNAHYHELLHLLINYKLGKLPLYTHPFLQEGFAVAFGGRGGKEPDVILDLGLFLEKSKMLGYESLLSKKDFYSVDASLSYPLSGLFNLFLFHAIGLNEYLNLYRKYSGNSKQVEGMKILQSELPDLKYWSKFLQNRESISTVRFWEESQKEDLLYQSDFVRIYEDSSDYYFAMKDTLLVKTEEYYKGYKSKKYYEIIKHKEFKDEKYLLMINDNEFAIYNLYTNNLILNFVSSFSIPFIPVYKKNGWYQLKVSKSVFDGKINDAQFLQY